MLPRTLRCSPTSACIPGQFHIITCFGATAEFAAGLKKGAHVHVTGYLRSREVEKLVTGNKTGATVIFTAWEVRAIRIAKLDRAVEANPATDTPADDSILF